MDVGPWCRCVARVAQRGKPEATVLSLSAGGNAAGRSLAAFPAGTMGRKCNAPKIDEVWLGGYRRIRARLDDDEHSPADNGEREEGGWIDSGMGSKRPDVEGLRSA